MDNLFAISSLLFLSLLFTFFFLLLLGARRRELDNITRVWPGKDVPIIREARRDRNLARLILVILITVDLVLAGLASILIWV